MHSGNERVALASGLRVLGEIPPEHVVLMVDGAGAITSWNETAEELFGWTPAEILGQRVEMLYEKSLREKSAARRQLIAAAMRGSVERSSCLRRKRGEVFHAVTTVTALKDGRGKPRGHVLLVESGRTDSRSHTERIPDADRLLRRAAVGVTVQVAGGRLLYANETAARLCGYESPEALIASPVRSILSRFALLGEEGEPFAAERLPGSRVLVGEEPEPVLIQVLERASGRRWWSRLFAKAVRGPGGAPELAINVWYDVTEEQRRKESVEHLLELTASLMDTLDLDTRLERLADDLVPRVADWCAIELFEDAVRRPLVVRGTDCGKVEELRALVADDRGRLAALARSPQLVPVIEDAQLTAVARNAEQLAFLRSLRLRAAIVMPISTKDHHTGAMVLATDDASGRTYDARDLALARELAERASALLDNARSYLAAQEAVRMRDDFLSVAAHELRTPLASLSLLLEALHESSEGDLARRLELGVRQARRLASLIEALLDISRVTRGHLTLDVAETDVCELVREVVARFATEAEVAHCELRASIAPECKAQVDRMRVEQVVSNLISNALKYGRGKPVHVSCCFRGDEVHIEVRDHGAGIAPENHERIFGRFERAVGDRSIPGLGIGLWVVREIVTAHGGRIELRSKPDEGSTFEVALPRVVRAGVSAGKAS